jgi:hypothetical protein
MKNFFMLSIILIPSLLCGVAKDGEELQTLDNLIASSERQLVIHKELRSLIAQFQKQQDLFQEGQQTKELAIQMVQTASKILKTAEENHLMHLFTPFFVEELKLFSGITKKKSTSP